MPIYILLVDDHSLLTGQGAGSLFNIWMPLALVIKHKREIREDAKTYSGCR